MLELKKLSGRLNLDDPYENVEPGDHVGAMNIRFVNGQVQSVKGNTLVSYSMPAGTNITIGNCYDSLNQRIFFTNYNSNATHGIYIYYIKTNSIVTLAINGVDTDGDVFQFTADSYFPDMQVMYGDDTQGDILYYLNSQKLPCKININRALGSLGTYGTIQKSYLTVDKEIPQIPPAVTFEDDTSVTVNNFRKKLMKYKARYFFDDKDKSAYSSQSVIPLPIGYTDTNADANADPSINARVAIVVPTWKNNVKKIEICACESLGNVFSDWFLIHTIDKEIDGVDDDTLFTYRFYNDQAYTFIEIAESEQEFDWVPPQANAQELINGNVPAYAGILEGYNQVTSDTTTTSGTEEDLKTTQYPFIFVSTQSGNSGFGTGNILTKYIGQVPVGWTFHITTTNTDIQYTSLTGDDAADVLAGLAAAAVILGFTETHDGENVIVNKTGEALQLLLIDIAANTKNVAVGQLVSWDTATTTMKLIGAAGSVALYSGVTTFTIDNSTFPEYFDGVYNIVSVTVNGADLDIVISNTVYAVSGLFNGDITVYPNNVYGVLPVSDSFSYDWSSSYAFGVEYFDYWGRTMGVVTEQTNSVQTIPYNDSGNTLDVYLPKIGFSISHRPPSEACYFQIVRTKNLTKSNFLHWISDHTYKDTEYAYISIEILNQYIVVNPQSSFLAWDFTPGDRIRFMKRLYNPGAMSYASTSKDFEIIASLTNPYVNGVLIEGQVLKISLPTTDQFFDFGGDSWDNYLIEIYTPAKNVGNGLDVYYEFGERYMIGDAGLPTRFHQGMLQNQSTDLVTPATFEFIQGDNYFAQRRLNIGNVIKYSVDNDDATKTGGTFTPTIGMTLISGYDVQDYIVQSQPFNNTGTFTPSDYFIKVINGTFTFTIIWNFRVRINSWDNGVSFLALYYYEGTTPHLLEQKDSPFVANQILEYSGTTTVTRDNSDDGTMILAFLSALPPGDSVDITIISGYVSVDQLGKVFTVGIQNPNYSFFYESAINSNGRPWLVNPDGRQSYNMSLMRHGLAYQQETNINQSNRFYSSNLDQYDRSKGDVRRLKFRQRQLRIFQASGVGQVGVYAQFITNSAGQTQLIYTTAIITANNIQYYLGNYGMGEQNTSLVSNKNQDYFIDPVTGDLVRVSNDGMTSVSDLYKGQYYIANLLTPYNYVWNRQDGSVAKILGAYDYFDEQVVYVLQSGTRADYANALNYNTEYTEGNVYGVSLGGHPEIGDTIYLTLTDIGLAQSESYSYVNIGDDPEDMILAIIALINAGSLFTATYEGVADAGLIATTVSENSIAGSAFITFANAISIPSYAFSFNEKRNSFCSFYNFDGLESVVSAENTMYHFLNGQLYSQNSDTYCNFFGVQYSPSITLDYNGGEAAKKTFISLSYQANGVWAVPEIETQLDTFGQTAQTSKLVTANFRRLEGVYHASFLRDINSRGGWINGASLKGGFVVIKLVAPADGGYYFINVISVKSIPSPLNNT